MKVIQYYNHEIRRNSAETKQYHIDFGRENVQECALVPEFNILGITYGLLLRSVSIIGLQRINIITSNDRYSAGD